MLANPEFEDIDSEPFSDTEHQNGKLNKLGLVVFTNHYLDGIMMKEIIPTLDVFGGLLFEPLPDTNSQDGKLSILFVQALTKHAIKGRAVAQETPVLEDQIIIFEQSSDDESQQGNTSLLNLGNSAY